MNGYDRIYNGNRELSDPQRLKIKEYDAVISRLGSDLYFGATILQHLSENLGIYCPQKADGLLTAQDKMKTILRLSHDGIRVPMTVFAKNASHVQHLIKMLGGLPVIAKVLKGSQGLGVMICKDEEQTNTTLESFWGQSIDIMLQRFIDAKSKDVRAIVVGDRVVVAMERTGTKDFRANISQGGSGRKIELTDEQKQLCISAAKSVGLEFAGVDLMTDKDNKSYIIEVNGNPGSKIIDITGHNYFIDLVEHIQSKINKRRAAAPVSTGSKSDAQASELSILIGKERVGELSYNEHARLQFYKRSA
jgi:ribosomal protein S6--L-glutamate ligase